MDLLGKRTWGPAGETDVPVVSCNAGARKRFGTIQMCVAGDGKAQHPRIAVIFRGKGGVIIREQDQYHPQAPCPILAIDLSVLQFHQAPSPISVIHLSELLFHQAPSPILLIDLSELLLHQAPSPILPCEVDVYFNKCAWATRDFTVEWAKKTWMTFLRSQAQEMT